MHPEPVPTLPLPPTPEERSPTPPPVGMLLAPVVGAVLLWALTGSAMSLAFAALGPVMLVAGILDGRRRLRADRRREARRYAERLAEIGELIDDLHARERDSATARTPTAREWAEPAAAVNRWRTSPGEPLEVTVGRAAMPSSLRLLPERTGSEMPAAQRLRSSAGLLEDAPLAVDLRRGLCLLGDGAAADALLRSVLLQALSRMPPTSRVECAGEAEAWLDAVPHRTVHRRRSPDTAVRFSLSDGGAPAEIIRIVETSRWPRDCDTVVSVAAGEGRVLRHPHLTPGAPFAPDAVSAVEALAMARALSVAAPQTDAGIPQSVRLGALLTAEPRNAEGAAVSLRCPIGVSGGGTVEIDLVSDGPHAVIGGTTGSGKSELLRAWVQSIAALHPPSAVQFLLLDFKGGAAFSELTRLPHTVGVLTDLDRAAVRRAIESIRAELTHRERVLAAAGTRAIGDGGSGLARLVLVVDEFAALAEQLPECHAVLGDVAARGRSLGVHLILCTQRPAGVVRDGLLANAGLRICLRVTSEDDSRAVVGVPDAAGFGRAGLAILTRAGSPAVRMQVAEADALPTGIAGACDAAPVRRPWLPELPRSIDPRELPAGTGLVFGLTDRPEEQAQPPAVWDPPRQGGLLVIGGPGSGRSTALAAVAGAAGAPPAIRPRQTVPCVWDAVALALGRIEAGERAPRLLLLDDLDAVLAAAGPEYGPELADRLLRVLREGTVSGIAVALSASRIPAALGGAAALAGCRLLLRAASRDEHLLAGGSSATFDPSAPAGRGELGGFPVQVALAPPGAVPPSEETVPLRPLPGLLAVSTRPVALEPLLGPAPVQRLGSLPDPPAAGEAGSVLLGTPEEWQSRWSALRQLSATRPVLFDGCGPADVRSLLGRQELPPPCSGRPRWLFRPGEPAVRVRLPGDAQASTACRSAWSSP